MKRHSAANTNAEESSIAGMFQYLIGVLEPDQRRSWKILSLLSLISPAVDIFSFSIIMTVINRAIQENQASPELVAFTLSMVGVTAVKCLLFSAAMAAMYLLLIFFFRLEAVAADFAEYSALAAAGLLGNVTFLLFDRALGQLMRLYRWRFLKK